MFTCKSAVLDTAVADPAVELLCWPLCVPHVFWGVGSWWPVLDSWFRPAHSQWILSTNNGDAAKSCLHCHCPVVVARPLPSKRWFEDIGLGRSFRPAQRASITSSIHAIPMSITFTTHSSRTAGLIVCFIKHRVQHLLRTPDDWRGPNPPCRAHRRRHTLRVPELPARSQLAPEGQLRSNP